MVGDSLTVLQRIPDRSVNLVLTSPPYYQQRDYGVDGAIGNEDSLDEYVERLLSVFAECVRILTEDGHIVFNLGDKYMDGSLLLVPWRFATAVLKSQPVRLINTITWVKMNPTPRQFRRRLVSATEPFFDFVKSDEYYYNLDAYMALHGLLRKRAKNGGRLGTRYLSLIERSDLSEEQKAQARRELEQVIDEVRRGEIAGFRMKIRGIHAPAFGGQSGGRAIQMERKGFTIIRIRGEHIKRDVIECPVETIKGVGHPAIFPEFVVAQLILLLSPPDGVVLDPFVGSGTTTAVARKLGRHYIGIDINPTYVEYSRQRTEDVETLLDYVL